MTTDATNLGELLAQMPSPTLGAAAEMYLGLFSHITGVQQAKKEGKTIVWGSILMPQEIFHAMDMSMVYVELVGAIGAITGTSGQQCQAAEDAGFSRDVCAIHRSALGCVAASEETDSISQMVFAEPNLVVGTNFPCMSETKSFLYAVDRFNCPYCFVDTPIDTWGHDIPDYAVEYYVSQLKGMISFLEEHGYKMDWNRLKEEVAFTQKLNVIGKEIEEYRKAIPTPMRAFDSFIASLAPLVLPPAMRTLDLFERLRDELKERVDSHVGTVEEEKLRLLWIGIPPVCSFELLNYPEQYGAVFAKSMLEYIVGVPIEPELLDPERPLESLARGMLANPLNPPYKLGIDYLVKSVEDYHIDGVVSVVKRSCGLVPGMQRLAKEAIYERTGVPSVIFDLDGVDTREFDDVGSKASMDSFIETLLSRKGG